MLTVHSEFNNIVAGHPWQLFRYNVLQLNQVAHALDSLVVTDNDEIE